MSRGLRVSNNKKVLLVDDEPSLLQVASIMLKRLNCDVTTAGSGEEALSIVNEFNGDFDLLMTDMNMPDMSGLQLVQLTTEKFSDIKIVMLTGYGAESDLFDDNPLQIEILGKPFHFSDFQELISRLFSE